MPKTQTANIRLLKIIKRFPELYNLQHDLANDKTHSMVVWDTISDELETPANVLKKKWQKMCSLHKKRCRSLKAFSKSGAAPPPPQDDVFLLMDSMLETTGVDSPVETDDSSLCSAPTLSIISEEGGRSTRSRSSSSASTQLLSEFHERSPSAGKIWPEVRPSSTSSSSFPSLASAEKNAVSTRVLRSHNNLRIKRATRSGPPEVARNRQKDGSIIFYGGDSASASGKTRSALSENREKKTARLSNRSNNETVKTFFQTIALTVAKFSPHIQATTKTKIFNIVAEAEAESSSTIVTMR